MTSTLLFHSSPFRPRFGKMDTIPERKQKHTDCEKEDICLAKPLFQIPEIQTLCAEVVRNLSILFINLEQRDKVLEYPHTVSNGSLDAFVTNSIPKKWRHATSVKLFGNCQCQKMSHLPCDRACSISQLCPFLVDINVQSGPIEEHDFVVSTLRNARRVTDTPAH